MNIGIMGGTFNPIHIGHLVTADEARERFALDKVIFMPAGVHPHGKEISGGATPELRYQMTVAATADNPAFEVSRYELDKAGSSYTVDTVRCLREQMPATEIYFITGADAIMEILDWKDPQELLEMAVLIAASRPGYPLERLSDTAQQLGQPERIKFMEIPAIGISSSLIRDKVAAGRSIKYLVTEGVEQIIEKEDLYRQA
jgi:nicotinate-nucleotide adenylyltransferase